MVTDHVGNVSQTFSKGVVLMAKLSKTRAMVSDDVRRIRARFSQALAHGYTTEEATAHANGDGALVNKKPTPPQVSMSGPTKVRDTKPLGLEGKRQRPPEPELQPDKTDMTFWKNKTESVVEDSGTSGNAFLDLSEKEIKTKTSIPKDWQDLPWPKLKALAESISGSEVKSRKHANEVIDKVAG